MGESQGFVPVTAASASQAMAARDRNAKMPELKQPLLLSGALAATGSVAGQGIGLISPIRPRPRCARAWRRARMQARAGQELALVCGKMDLAKDTLSFSGCEARRRRRRARDGKTQGRAGRVLPGPADRCKSRHAGDQHLAVCAGTAGRQRLSRRRGALRGVHRGGQAAEPGAQERRIAALARGRRGPERVQSAPAALVRALGATTRAGRQARRPWRQGLHRVAAPDHGPQGHTAIVQPASDARLSLHCRIGRPRQATARLSPDSLPSPPILRVRPDISRSSRLVGSR